MMGESINSDYLSGCGDNSCMVQRPSGMATNGGCRCFGRGVLTKEETHQMRRKAMAVAKDRRRLQDQLRAAEDYIMDLKNAIMAAPCLVAREGEMTYECRLDNMCRVCRWRTEALAVDGT